MSDLFFETPSYHLVGSRGLPTLDAPPSRLVQAPAYHLEGAAGASGAGAGSAGAAGSGGAAGAGGGAAGAAGSGGGGTNPYRVTDDSLFDFGDGQPVRWGDARSTRFMDRAAYDRGVQFLQQMADQMDRQLRQHGQGQPGRGQQPPPRPPEDPLAGIDDLAVVDGKTLAKIARHMQAQGLGPLAQFAGQLATRLQTLEAQVKSQGQITGSLDERHRTEEFDQFLTKTLQGLPEIKGLGAISLDRPEIRELLADLYLSHDQQDPKLMPEFPRMAQARIEGLFKAFTELQKAAVEKAKQAKRQFFNVNRGVGQASGPPAYQHLTGEQIAAQAREAGFFGGS